MDNVQLIFVTDADSGIGEVSGNIVIKDDDEEQPIEEPDDIEIPQYTRRGDTISVILSVSGKNSGVEGVDGVFDYDTNVFETVSAEILDNKWEVYEPDTNTHAFMAYVTDSTNTNEECKCPENSAFEKYLSKIILALLLCFLI